MSTHTPPDYPLLNVRSTTQLSHTITSPLGFCSVHPQATFPPYIHSKKYPLLITPPPHTSYPHDTHQSTTLSLHVVIHCILTPPPPIYTQHTLPNSATTNSSFIVNLQHAFLQTLHCATHRRTTSAFQSPCHYVP